MSVLKIQIYLFSFPGELKLTFDENGHLLVWSGQPIFLNSSIPQDEDVLELLKKYRPAVNDVNTEIIGSAQVTLDGGDNTCRSIECNYGNLIADANVFYKASFSSTTWTESPIGLMNGGSIRTSVTPGVNKWLTRGDILATLPFGNQIVSLKLRGSDLLKTLELGIRSNGETSAGEFLQVSGLQVVYDRSKPAMARVVSVKTRCGYCAIPTYQNIDPNKNYSIVTTDFLADGYDGHYVLKEKSFDKKFEDLGDIDVLVWYFQKYSPVYSEVQGRITFVESLMQEQSNGALFIPINFWILILMVYFTID